MKQFLKRFEDPLMVLEKIQAVSQKLGLSQVYWGNVEARPGSFQDSSSIRDNRVKFEILKTTQTQKIKTCRQIISRL